ncbi:MAG: acyl-CoA carboxylase epsilon subunit [Acidimicrobiales bacterium]
MTEVVVSGRANPDPEELAAIVAAVQVVVNSGGAAPEPAPPVTPRWRFSGRWWSRPIPSRRDRPAPW